MDQLGTFQLNDARRLFELAKALHQKRFFNHHLTAEQCHIINAILERDNFQLWRQFLDGNCCLVIAKDSSDDESADSIPEGTEPVTQLALRIRYLLWEKAINFYYDKTSRENSGSLATIEELPKEHEMIELLDQLPEESNEESVPQEKTNVRDEEDDYDDDEDEENGEDKSKTSNGQEATVLKLNDNGQVMEGSVFAKSSEPDSEQEEERTQEPGAQEINAAESLEEQEATIKSFNKVYHNFEYDRETLIKKRKLDKSDMQLENQKTTENTESGEIPINLGLVSHSLKHLLNTIQERRDDISLNDLELRTLFMDVRKNRGKWANDERVGQEELYDACEKWVHRTLDTVLEQSFQKGGAQLWAHHKKAHGLEHSDEKIERIGVQFEAGVRGRLDAYMEQLFNIQLEPKALFACTRFGDAKTNTETCSIDS